MRGVKPQRATTHHNSHRNYHDAFMMLLLVIAVAFGQGENDWLQNYAGENNTLICAYIESRDT